jgi:hypothetical protein
MRRHWRERVAELASWMPQPWHAAVQWCSVLIELPTLQHLAAGAAPPQWMADDPIWHAVVTDGAPVDDAWQPLLAAARIDAKAVLPRWQTEWVRRLPGGEGRATLDEQLVPLLAGHVAAFAAPQASDGWALRHALQRRLHLMLRRVLLEPATAFVYLALCALEFERLRGELLRRVVFADSARSRTAP